MIKDLEVGVVISGELDRLDVVTKALRSRRQKWETGSQRRR